MEIFEGKWCLIYSWFNLKIEWPRFLKFVTLVLILIKIRGNEIREGGAIALGKSIKNLNKLINLVLHLEYGTI
jgi:hypothetical protein